MNFSPVTLAAPAKLNLYLHVTGRREDGYHLLDSLVAFTDIYDTLTLSPAAELRFTADGPFAGGFGDEDPATNLVVRAARALAEAVGRRDVPVAFHLRKNLPVASGIGGGSADAAAALRGLARLWDIDPLSPAVLGVAARLGADIPACVAGRACYMGGIGTELSPAPDLPEAGLLLVNPGVGLSTPSVYKARRGGFTPEMRFADPPAHADALAALLAERRNDLAEPAITLLPVIGEVLAAIADLPGCKLAQMSGSGATCFGIFADLNAAQRAGDVLKESRPGWWVAPGRLLTDANVLDRTVG